MEKQEAGPSATSPRRRALDGATSGLMLLFYAMPYALSLLCAFWGMRYAAGAWHLSLWLAVPFGLAVGALCLALVTEGFTGTLLEAGVRSTILIALGLILWPIFNHAREHARLVRQQTAIHAHRRAP